MFWKKKKKDMVDLRDLSKSRAVMPQQQPTLPTNQEGFVQMNTNQQSQSTEETTPSVLGFLDNPASTTTTTISPSSSDDIRKLTDRIERLDNLLYKLEQRIELLERKVGVNQSY